MSDVGGRTLLYAFSVEREPERATHAPGGVTVAIKLIFVTISE